METKNLDGETNLKYKECHKECLNLLIKQEDLKISKDPTLQDQEQENLIFKKFSKLSINCEEPNFHLYNFDGSLKFKDGKEIPLGPDNFLLRGCSL